MSTRPQASPALRLWGWPIAIAAVTAVGLVAGLIGDGLFDALSWVALAVPVVALWLAWRRRTC